LQLNVLAGISGCESQSAFPNRRVSGTTSPVQMLYLLARIFSQQSVTNFLVVFLPANRADFANAKS
jgi:hypothetical protein